MRIAAPEHDRHNSRQPCRFGSALIQFRHLERFFRKFVNHGAGNVFPLSAGFAENLVHRFIIRQIVRIKTGAFNFFPCGFPHRVETGFHGVDFRQRLHRQIPCRRRGDHADAAELLIPDRLLRLPENRGARYRRQGTDVVFLERPRRVECETALTLDPHLVRRRRFFDPFLRPARLLCAALLQFAGTVEFPRRRVSPQPRIILADDHPVVFLMGCPRLFTPHRRMVNHIRERLQMPRRIHSLVSPDRFRHFRVLVDDQIQTRGRSDVRQRVASVVQTVFPGEPAHPVPAFVAADPPFQVVVQRCAVIVQHMSLRHARAEKNARARMPGGTSRAISALLFAVGRFTRFSM